MPDKKTSNEKKSPKLPKWLLWGALAAAILLIGSVLAVNILYRTSVDEDSEATEAELTEEEQMEKALQEEVEREPYITWESMEIPEVYPEYNNGDVATPDPAFQWYGEGIPNFITILNTDETAIQTYIDKALQNNWKLEESPEEPGEEDESWFLTVEGEETHSILLKWFAGDNSYLKMTLTSTPAEE